VNIDPRAALTSSDQRNPDGAEDLAWSLPPEGLSRALVMFVDDGGNLLVLDVAVQGRICRSAAVKSTACSARTVPGTPRGTFATQAA
jgi:hypothetical protein